MGDVFRQSDLTYETLSEEEFRNVLLKLLREIDQNRFSVSGKSRITDWERGWGENLEAFREKEFQVEALVPKYITKNHWKRLYHEFISPSDVNFEVSFYNIYRTFLFKRYLSQFDPIYEFGCGTGYNLYLLGELFPEKKLFGLDWAQNSVDLVQLIGKKKDRNMQGARFDFFEPDYAMDVPAQSAFVTFNSMEQIGENFLPFLQWILKKKPAICINSEPFYELYNDKKLLDYLAKKYHKQRNYLIGYYDELLRLEKAGKIEIVKAQRVKFGSFFHEGYSYVVWKPR